MFHGRLWEVVRPELVQLSMQLLGVLKSQWLSATIGLPVNYYTSSAKSVLNNAIPAGTSSKSTKLIHGGVRYLQKAIMELDYEQYVYLRRSDMCKLLTSNAFTDGSSSEKLCMSARLSLKSHLIFLTHSLSCFLSTRKEALHRTHASRLTQISSVTGKSPTSGPAARSTMFLLVSRNCQHVFHGLN